MSGSAQPQWIAVDWGTSRLRVWAMNGGDMAIASRQSDEGMGKLKPSEFEGALLRLIGDWLDNRATMPVVACGMVGARQGWAEAEYLAVPCRPAGDAAFVVPDTDPRIRVHILPGLKQDRPADVMRGEETQIAGFLSQHPDYTGFVCLPGTHSKWARVADGKVLSFSTFMTGEMFALLSEQSVLRHSVADDGWDDDCFAESLKHTLISPELAPADLFELRAESLLHGVAPETARAKLSGILLGMELAATRTHWHDKPVTIIGAAGLGARYVQALQVVGGSAELADGDAMTLAGLIAAYRQLRGKEA